MATTQVEDRNLSRVKPRPTWLRALGGGSPPEQLQIGGRMHRLVEVFKHDSWAATALYAGPNDALKVVKLHRRSSAFGVPLSWVGWLTARREQRLLRKLADLPGIPALAGPVLAEGIPQRNVVAREYLQGHPLGDREAVNDRFFPELSDLLHAMHGRRIAYVDLHKRENVLVGEDGAPGLFDFQISFDWPKWLPIRPVFSILSASDDYHLLKLWARCRPDQCGGLDSEATVKRPWWIRTHRVIARPIREMRRRLLVRIGVRTGKGRVESEQFAEHALRTPAPSDRQAA